MKQHLPISTALYPERTAERVSLAFSVR